MRQLWCAVVIAAILALTVTGCTKAITGVAQPDPRKPGTALTSDGYGIVAGFPDAPVQLELFTEPQCNHCAGFQATYGEDIKHHIETGQLVVTYRPLTFLDDEFNIDYSAKAANTLFLAAGSGTSAAIFQTFVEQLWANQDLSHDYYSNSDFADLARDSGVAGDIVDRIGSGDSGVNTTEMNAVNTDSLAQISDGNIATPTLYNMKTKAVVDISERNWLNKVLDGS
jgi:protein-disulfide isomerase